MKKKEIKLWNYKPYDYALYDELRKLAREEIREIKSSRSRNVKNHVR